MGAVDLAAELMRRYPDHKGLTGALGEFLGKTGAGNVIDGLVNQIITTAKTQPEGWKRALELLCGKLAVVIPADVDSVNKSFAQVASMCDVLAPVVKGNMDDALLLEAISLVSRRLVDRFEPKVTGYAAPLSSPYGTNAVVTHLVGALATVLAADGVKANQNKNFVMNGYHTLAVTARDPKTHLKVVECSKSTNLIAITYATLAHHQNDPDVALRIMEYLAAMASTDDGLTALIEGFPHKPGQVMKTRCSFAKTKYIFATQTFLF